jgi:hypothetical protein
MLTDPQTLTVNAVAKNCPRIKEQNGTSTYRLRTTTDELVLAISHATGKITGGVDGESHVVKVTYKVFATSTLPEYVLVTWIVIQNGKGMDLTTVKNHVLALCAYMTGATIDKLLGGEN